MGRSPLEWLCFIIAVGQRTFHSLFNAYDFRAETTCGILIQLDAPQRVALSEGDTVHRVG
jgi:hypothetical protein